MVHDGVEPEAIVVFAARHSDPAQQTAQGRALTEAIRAQLDLKVGDAVFFAAGEPDAFYKFAGAARTKVGTDLGLIDENQFKFCWIVDFPM